MKIDFSLHHGCGVEPFLAKLGMDVTGVIRGFDRPDAGKAVARPISMVSPFL
jgi:hypothetical protein